VRHPQGWHGAFHQIQFCRVPLIGVVHDEKAA
jgi:hypothetical protein